MTLRSRYLLNMLGVSILHFFAFISFMLITGKMDRILLGVPLNLAMLVVVNLVGASVIFSPIQKFLQGEIEFNRAVKRIHQLPWMSSAWACSLVLVLSFFAFFVLNVICPTCNLADMAPFYVSMMVIFGTFVGIFMFFLIDDFAATLKAEIFAEFGELIKPTGARLRRKFIAAFVAIGIAPGMLLFLEIFAFSDIRKLQGLTSEQAFSFDLLLITMIAGSSYYFIQKNLSRPIESLLLSMQEFGRGKSHAKVIATVDGRYQGNWQKYISRWISYRDRMQNLFANKSVAVVKSRGIRMQGVQLQNHIKDINSRLDVLNCLKKENEASAGIVLENFNTAAGGNSPARSSKNQVAAISGNQLDIEVTAKCDKDSAIFQITNLGDKWPRLGEIYIYKVKGKSLLSKRRVRMGNSQQATFRIRKRGGGSYGPVGLWVSPSWDKRAFKYDATISCG